jgi:hypothetical protein
MASQTHFDGMTLPADNGETEIIDSSHLDGLLERIARLDLTPHSITRVDSDHAEADSQPQTQSARIDDHDPGTHSKGL